MALYDMLRNAQQVSLLDIDHRQSLLAGDYDLLGKEGEPGARVAVAADRAAFVRTFYDYAKANPNGQPQLWTEWLKSQP
jgi:protein-tyrosine phosphatase